VSTETETAPTEERELTAADFEDDGGEEAPAEVQAEAPPSSETASQEETVSQGDGESEEQPGEEAEEQQPEEGEPDAYAEPPEFWPAARKALWDSKQIPADVRQAIHEHVAEASRATSGRLEEAASAKKNAEALAEQLAKDREAAAQYWASPVSVLQAMFQGRWGNVDLAKVAAENPAEAVRLREMRDQEAALVQKAAQDHQQQTQAMQTQQATKLETAKRAEHEKLATKLPQYFGSDKAQATYDELGDFLASKGVPRDRIANIYEAPVIEIALEAMLYSKAQAKLKAVGKPAAQAQPTTATQTSRRIVPGARPAGQPSKGNALRQAEQRLRNGQDLSDDEAALLFG
jgi:hypothetical protein